MRPVLQTLFSSSIFFGPDARHAIIKSPADFVLGTQRTLEAAVNLRESVALMGQLGQSLFEPPTVEGWKGGRAWINSATHAGTSEFRRGADHREADTAKSPIRQSRQLGCGWQESHDAVDYYIELLLARDVPTAQPAIEKYLNQASGPLGEQLRGVLHLLLTLPEFQLV